MTALTDADQDAGLRDYVDRLRSWGENDPDPNYFTGDVLNCLLLDCGHASVAFATLRARATAAEAERDEAKEEIDAVREDSAQQMRMLDRIAEKLGLAHDEGLEDAEPFLAVIDGIRSRATAAEDKLKDREAEIERLKIAFHDAIRRPLGVTPDSGAEFYDPRMAYEAEARRASNLAGSI